ncbi:MAG: alpha/beta fold hydrolase [Gammaproteobacteria bacterium]|nr:alpha/beta fold hydrolase [Gammaproteobacteria bacterium]
MERSSKYSPAQYGCRPGQHPPSLRSLVAHAALVCMCATAAGQPPDRAVVGQLEIEGVPPVPEALLARLRPYQNTRQASFLGWIGDGILIGTRFGNTTQLHRVETPLGARRQLTFFDEPIGAAHVSPVPVPEGFIYARDVGGSEFYQLFRFNFASGESKMLTDGKSRYSGVVWSKDGQRFAHTTTERNGVDWDIHIQDLAGSTTVALAAGGTGWRATDWSPDGERLLAIHYISINESYLYEVEPGTGAATRLLSDAPSAAITNARYDDTGGYVFFASDMHVEAVALHRMRRADGVTEVVAEDSRWGVEGFAIGGNRLAFTTNEDGVSRLRVLELPGLVPAPLPDLPDGIYFSLRFSADGNRLGFAVNRASAPTDVYSIDFAEATLTRWTRSEPGGLREENMAEPELVHYPAFDGREIPAFVYLPTGHGPHPVLIEIHGGPEGQYRPRFSSATQFLVNELGIAVVAPNVRGSAGYGKAYLKLDNGYLREDSVKDIGALLDWIATRDDLDAERVVVSGGSYGGYMVLASLVHFGDRLTAGVERVGISNFVTFLKNTQGYRRDLRRAEYGDERDPDMRDFLQRISPLNQVEKIGRPMLIAQGLNDPRVPASESEQIVAALRERDVPVWYVLARDEGHGFRKKVNRDHLTAATALFLEHHLLNGTAEHAPGGVVNQDATAE